MMLSLLRPTTITSMTSCRMQWNSVRSFAISTSTSPQMKRHHERRLLRFSQSLLFEVVSDVSQYAQFVPWCKQSTVLTRLDAKHMTAELQVGFQVFSERYLSHVTIESPKRVIAISKQTQLFDHLRSEWNFSPSSSDPQNATWVTFAIEFQFKSALYNEVSELFMQEVVKKMVKAFETRCLALQSQRRNK